MKMKKILFSIVFLLLSLNVLAQTKYEISASLGGPDWMLGTVGGGESTLSTMIDVKFTPMKWISIGLTGGLHGRGSSGEEGKHYNTNLMVMVYGNWYDNDRVRLYSGLGFGTHASGLNSEGRRPWGFEFTPLGVSYGQKIFGFAEVGTGWMFCPIRAGVGYRF